MDLQALSKWPHCFRYQGPRFPSSQYRYSPKGCVTSNYAVVNYYRKRYAMEDDIKIVDADI